MGPRGDPGHMAQARMDRGFGMGQGFGGNPHPGRRNFPDMDYDGGQKRRRYWAKMLLQKCNDVIDTAMYNCDGKVSAHAVVGPEYFATSKSLSKVLKGCTCRAVETAVNYTWQWYDCMCC